MVNFRLMFFFLSICYCVQAANPGKVIDPNITRYSVKVLPVSFFKVFYIIKFKFLA